MRFVARAEDAQRSRRYVEVEEGAAWVQDYFGRKTALDFNDGRPPEHGMACPQAFLVEQQPNQVADPHFHLIDQFQVVVGGDGLFGKRPIAGIAVHYANAYTTYGPIAAGPAGVHYITMRNRWDRTLAHFMPKCRAELKPEPRRHLFLDPMQPAAEADFAAMRNPAVQSLHEAEDGLAVWRFRVPGGQAADGPDPATGAGQYWLVLSGGLLIDGDDLLGPLSCVFLPRDEAALEIAAAPGGVEMLGLQFPVRH
jgi:hypothetical protein